MGGNIVVRVQGVLTGTAELAFALPSCPARRVLERRRRQPLFARYCMPGLFSSVLAQCG